MAHFFRGGRNAVISQKYQRCMTCMASQVNTNSKSYITRFYDFAERIRDSLKLRPRLAQSNLNMARTSLERCFKFCNKENDWALDQRKNWLILWTFFKYEKITSSSIPLGSSTLSMKRSREVSFFRDKYFSISRWASGLKYFSKEKEAGSPSIRSPAFGYWSHRSLLVTRLKKKKQKEKKKKTWWYKTRQYFKKVEMNYFTVSQIAHNLKRIMEYVLHSFVSSPHAWGNIIIIWYDKRKDEKEKSYHAKIVILKTSKLNLFKIFKTL